MLAPKPTRLATQILPFMAKVILVKNLDLMRRGSTCPMEVQVVRLDSDTAFVFLPCEIFVELGLAIKHSSPFEKTIVISICNESPQLRPDQKKHSQKAATKSPMLA